MCTFLPTRDFRDKKGSARAAWKRYKVANKSRSEKMVIMLPTAVAKKLYWIDGDRVEVDMDDQKGEGLIRRVPSGELGYKITGLGLKSTNMTVQVAAQPGMIFPTSYEEEEIEYEITPDGHVFFAVSRFAVIGPDGKVRPVEHESPNGDR